ncbi:rhodanese-like domain-containing protein, partial [Candidatus Seribacter sulfatis]|uniref:rhodanese-like domain-containing protein n=1 Tax=Candidatus Seribacter sulfatis TaxID=3381756 RepID=UPI00389A245C
MKNLSVQESNHQRLKNTASSFIDVRTPAEFRAVHAERAVNYPMESFDLEQFPLSKDEEIHVICQSGGRSMKVCQKLEAAGFTKIVNVEGGTSAWQS